MIELLLHAVGEALHLDLGPFGSDHDGMGGPQGLGDAELLADFFLGEGKADTPSLATKLLGKVQGVGSMGLVCDHEIDLDGRISLKSRFLLGLGRRAFVEKLQQDGVANTESHSRKIRRSITQISKQSVVTSPTRDGTQACFESESLKNNSRVVSESAHHSEVRADIIAQTAGFQIG